MPENYKLASIRVDPPSIPAALESGVLVQGTGGRSIFCCGFSDIDLPIGAIPLSYAPFPSNHPINVHSGILYFLMPTSSVKEM